MIAADLLNRIHEAGGNATLSGQWIKLKARRPLPVDLMDELRRHKAELLAFLSGEPESEDELKTGLQVYEYKLSDNQGSWLILLAPNCSLKSAKQSLRDRFGAERLLVVRRRKEIHLAEPERFRLTMSKTKPPTEKE